MDISGNLSTSVYLSSLTNINATNRVNNHNSDSVEESAELVDTPSRKIRPLSNMVQELRDVNNSVSLLQTAEAGFQNLSEGIEQIRDLTMLALNKEVTDEERLDLNNQVQDIKTSLTDNLNNVQFNEASLLKQSENSLAFHISANESGQIELGVLDVQSLFARTDFYQLNLSTKEQAEHSLDLLDNVQQEMQKVADGISQSSTRIEDYIDSLSISQEDDLERMSPIQDKALAEDVAALINEQLKRDSSIFLQLDISSTQRMVLGLLKSIN